MGNWREEWHPRGLVHTISEGCQAWKEAALVSTGEMEVPRFRIGCREKQVHQEDEVKVVATAVEAEGSRGALGKRGPRGGGQRRRERAAGKPKKAKGQPQGEVRSDGGQGWQVTGKRRVEGQGGMGICDQGGVLGDRQATVLGDSLEVRDDMLPGPRGEGPGWRAGQEAYLWDRITGQILERDGRPTRNEEWLAAEEEKIKDREATEVAADICSGTQSMKPVYRRRKKHAYVALDDRVETFSAAQQKTVKNIRYDIMETSPEETMVVIVKETQRLKPRMKVQRIKLEEVWLSVPCGSYSKMD
jgi:hypothetical protein